MRACGDRLAGGLETGKRVVARTGVGPQRETEDRAAAVGYTGGVLIIWQAVEWR